MHEGITSHLLIIFQSIVHFISGDLVQGVVVKQRWQKTYVMTDVDISGFVEPSIFFHKKLQVKWATLTR